MAYGTIEELKSDLARRGVAEPPADGTLALYLDEAGDLIDAYCSRDFGLHEDATVVAEGKGLDSLLLPVSPILAVKSVTVDGLPLSASELAGLEVLSYGVLRGIFFPAGSVVQIQCDWGFGTPPVAVQRASVRLASRLVRHGAIREKAAEGLRSQSVEGVSVSLDPIEMDRDVARMLDPYRKRRAAR
jgi:hypothetical protein